MRSEKRREVNPNLHKICYNNVTANLSPGFESESLRLFDTSNVSAKRCAYSLYPYAASLFPGKACYASGVCVPSASSGAKCYHKMILSQREASIGAKRIHWSIMVVGKIGNGDSPSESLQRL